MKKITSILFVFLFASLIYGHECFIIAYKFLVKEGEDLELHLFIADGFNIQLEKPFQKTSTKKFELINEKGKFDLLQTEDGKFPIANYKVDFKGLGIIVMERNPVFHSMEQEKFRAYLKEDHIENIVIDRSKKLQKETYTRYIKTLVQSDFKKNDSLYKTIVGSKYEIVLLQNPYLLHKGENLKAKVLFDGKPLVNKVITARNRTGNQPAIVAYSRTDKNGICTFKLKREGDWIIHSTHMIPFSDKKIADWESFWVTYSFGFYNTI